MGVEEVKHDDGHAGPGDDQSQHQDPGHGRAEGRVEVVGHGALGNPERRARGVAIFALDDGGGGGGVSSWREREREGGVGGGGENTGIEKCLMLE